jgi:hypothetical protein
MHSGYFLLIATLIINVLCIRANDSTNLVKYTNDFEFENGIFLNFEQVKNNSPIPKARILSTTDYNDRNFYEKVLSEKLIYFFDANGVKQTVQPSKIWGFSKKGTLFINVEGNFNRITVVGRASYFVATIVSYNQSYYDPYYYGTRNFYGMNPSMYETTEMKQFILDFQTGQLLDFDRKGVEMILSRDPELHDEYANLRKRKKKQLKFYYLRKFNERNPLYLPEN